MENDVQVKKLSLQLIPLIRNKSTPLPFLIMTHTGKPFAAIGKNKEGNCFLSSYFMLKNDLLNGTCKELMILEPVESDGCIVEFPNHFYSLRTTTSSIFVSVECFSAIQTFSSKDVDRELIDPCTKD